MERALPLPTVAAASVGDLASRRLQWSAEHLFEHSSIVSDDDGKGRMVVKLAGSSELLKEGEGERGGSGPRAPGSARRARLIHQFMNLIILSSPCIAILYKGALFKQINVKFLFLFKKRKNFMIKFRFFTYSEIKMLFEIAFSRRFMKALFKKFNEGVECEGGVAPGALQSPGRDRNHPPLPPPLAR